MFYYNHVGVIGGGPSPGNRGLGLRIDGLGLH